MAFPKVENLIRISEYYGVSIDYLVGQPPENPISMLVSLGFSEKAAEELAILSNHGNGGWAQRRFAALNRLIEETDDFEAIISALELCLRFGKTLTYYQADLIKAGRKPEPNEELFAQADRAMFRSAAIFNPQNILGRIAEKFVNESEEKADRERSASNAVSEKKD